MKYLFIFLLTILFSVGCKQKVLTGVELQNKLIETMNDYLKKTHDPSVTFKVHDVNYFPDTVKQNFVCQFHVTMHIKGKDTTGIVAPRISPDFTTVDRTR